MQKVYIVAGKRTPIGSLLGKLSKKSATELGAIATKAALNSINLDGNNIDEVLMGNVISAGLGQNPAKQVSLMAGINKGTPCTLVNKVCASGMKTACFGFESLRTNRNKIVVAGGFESMSNIPFLIMNHRRGIPFGTQQLIDCLAFDGLTDKYNNVAMGLCGEKTADEMKITRDIQDEYCIESYNRTINAQKNNLFKNEIIEVEIGKDKFIEVDEEPLKFRPEKIPLLRSVFSKNGTITAANASKINDGACSLVLMNEESVKKHNITPLAEFVNFADYEVDPMDFNISPHLSANKVLENSNLKKEDIDFWEFNEAFSVTGLANMKLLDLNPKTVNVNGGAVALGHPIGMSGSRILLSLITVLKQNNGKYGLAGICNGGGGSTSVILKNIN